MFTCVDAPLDSHNCDWDVCEIIRSGTSAFCLIAAAAERAAAERAAADAAAAERAAKRAAKRAAEHVAAAAIAELQAYLCESREREVRLADVYAELLDVVKNAQRKLEPFETVRSNLLVKYPDEQPNTGGNSSAPAPTAPAPTATAPATASAPTSGDNDPCSDDEDEDPASAPNRVPSAVEPSAVECAQLHLDRALGKFELNVNEHTPAEVRDMYIKEVNRALDLLNRAQALACVESS